MSFSRFIAIALVALALAACTNVPRPFSPGTKSGTVPPPGPTSALIVHPVLSNEGVSTDGLTALVIKGLQERQVAAIPYDVPNRYRLLGEAIATQIVGTTATVSMRWQLTRPDRTPVSTDAYEAEVDWDAFRSGDAVTMNLLAAEAVGRIAVLLGIESPADAGSTGPDLLIAPIRRAPGDGAEALSAAIILELERQGLEAVPEDGRLQLPVLEALVRVSPVDGSNDLVRIAWLLRDETGAERGRLEQQNMVPTNRLSRRWGVVARLAASAAAPGVADLMQRLRATE
ncbi:hypothetical protein [Minwuia sp.]|uniref:hypothetical protein n=1 Tax=Minwuia sp. TaxID=2493630 RepID=UPI003A94F48F